MYSVCESRLGELLVEKEAVSMSEELRDKVRERYAEASPWRQRGRWWMLRLLVLRVRFGGAEGGPHDRELLG